MYTEEDQVKLHIVSLKSTIAELPAAALQATW